MSEVAFETSVHVRTTGAAKLALDQVVARLRASRRARWKEKRVTQEAIVNASWLWLADLDPSEVEALMVRYLARLEAIMSDDAGADPGPTRAESPPPPAKARGLVGKLVGPKAGAAEEKARKKA